jgi:hypothetical protein
VLTSHLAAMHEKIQRIDRRETDNETWDDDWQRAKLQRARNHLKRNRGHQHAAGEKVSDMKKAVGAGQSASAPPSMDAAAAEPAVSATVKKFDCTRS